MDGGQTRIEETYNLFRRHDAELHVSHFLQGRRAVRELVRRHLSNPCSRLRNEGREGGVAR